MHITVCISISGSKVSNKKHVCLKQSGFISKAITLQTAVHVSGRKRRPS